jgi:hypothetical protein
MGSRRGGIGSEHQQVELGFERAKQRVIELELSGLVPGSLCVSTRVDPVDLRIEYWSQFNVAESAASEARRGGVAIS